MGERVLTDKSGVYEVSWAERQQREFERKLPEKLCRCGKKRLPGMLYCIDHARFQ